MSGVYFHVAIARGHLLGTEDKTLVGEVRLWKAYRQQRTVVFAFHDEELAVAALVLLGNVDDAALLPLLAEVAAANPTLPLRGELSLPASLQGVCHPLWLDLEAVQYNLEVPVPQGR
jgi:hypothetical protein